MIKDNKIKRRIIYNFIFKFFIIFTAFIAIIPLFLILFYIFQKGISVINWDLLFSIPKPFGESGGGIAHAIIGTFILLIIASIFSLPIGIACGIYLSENKKGKLAFLVRNSVESLQGIPSIIIGAIAFIWVVLPLSRIPGFNGFSAFAGGIALFLIMLPVIIKTTEETLNLIPYTYKEASFALGVPYYKTILKVIVPSGANGIITGILISIARIAGETAPLILTAFGNDYLNFNIFKPIEALPLLIYKYTITTFDNSKIPIAWGASFILITIVLILNLFIRLAVKKWKR